MNSFLGKILILTGVLIALLGVVIYFLPGKFSWIGNLPGDIKIERKNFRFYFPLTTMILFSLLLTLFVRIWRWLQ
ncbi:MAG: DUF2905 domain-containing protein [Daejeonella sp.]